MVGRMDKPGRAMRRMAGLFGGVLWVLCVCAPWGMARDGVGNRHALKHQVERMERAWRSAQLSGDTAAMDQMLAEDYVGMTLQGQVTTKAQQLRRMQERRLPLSRLDLSDIKVRLMGEVAVVTMRARVVAAGGPAPVDGRFRCRQVFRLLPDGRWSMTNFEAEPLDHKGERGMERAS